MTPRRFLFFVLATALSFTVSARHVRAQEEPAKDEPVQEEPVKEEPAKEEFVQGEDLPPAPRVSKKKTPSKKKAYDYERSKYKSREPSQTPVYKFNEKGEPIRAGAKKKTSTKKKRSEPPEAGMKEGAACGLESSCAEKKSEADSL